MPVLAAGLVPEFQLVEIEHIGGHVGYAPSYVLIEADDDGRCAGYGHAVHVHARRAQLNLVPDARQVKLQVRVVGQQRITRSRLTAAHREVIRA